MNSMNSRSSMNSYEYCTDGVVEYPETYRIRHFGKSETYSRIQTNTTLPYSTQTTLRYTVLVLVQYSDDADDRPAGRYESRTGTRTVQCCCTRSLSYSYEYE